MPMDIGKEDVCSSGTLACVRAFARCVGCLQRSTPRFDDQGYPLSSEEAVRLQWTRCAQCRCGTHDWYRSSLASPEVTGATRAMVVDTPAVRAPEEACHGHS